MADGSTYNYHEQMAHQRSSGQTVPGQNRGDKWIKLHGSMILMDLLDYSPGTIKGDPWAFRK